MIRSDTTLTDSYVAGNALVIVDYGQITLYVKYTKGDETSMQLKLEYGNDTDTMYQDTEYTYSGGIDTGTLKVITFATTGNYRIPLTVVDKNLRVSVKATSGTPTGKAMINVYVGRP